MKRKAFMLIAALVVSLCSFAGVLRVPTVIGDYMVLQRESVAHVWGWSSAGSQVVVEASWLSAPVTTTADGEGRWIANVATGKASENESLTISSEGEVLMFQDIMIGEVWVCSGQSNMQWNVGRSIDVKDALEFPNEKIRLYNSGRIAAAEPQNDIPEATWTTTNPGDLKEFSAVGYAFGDKLQKSLRVPVGLICVAYGGTAIEAWTPEEVVFGNELFALGHNKHIEDNKSKYTEKATGEMKPRYLAGGTYNANIHPILNTTIAGVIWYQGCHNVSFSGTYYDAQLEAMIGAWRSRFGNPNLPFYLVQIAPHTYEGVKGAVLREKQALVAAQMDHVEVVATIDQTDRLGDIHPRNKLVVGERLAACALGEHYGKNAEFRSPSYSRMEKKGNKIYLYFDNVGKKLVCYDKEIIGFQIGDGSEFCLAKAEIVGKDCVMVWSDNVKKPEAVRYCFDESVGNLQSVNSLPVLPFRTDSDNSILSARGYIPEFSDVEITVTGGRFVRNIFEPNLQLWNNRKFVITDALEGLLGFDCLTTEWLRKEEVIPSKVVITAEGDGRIYMLCRTWSWVYKQKDWKLLPNSKMTYRDPKRGITGNIWVAYKDVKKGEKSTIKFDSEVSSGFMPIASKINYR